MDCRRSLIVGLGLWVGLAGCQKQNSIPVRTNEEPPLAAKINKASDLPKRQPLPSTCVTLGNFRERAALEPDKSPADQQELREEARKAYQQALKIDPKNLGALTSLARLYTTLGDHQHAVQTYQRAGELHPRDAGVWYELGMCHARAKDWPPALQCLQRANELEPENRRYVNAYGFGLARAGRYEDSLHVFSRIEGEAVAHYNLARMLNHMKRYEQCRFHLQRAVALDRNLEPAQKLLVALDNPNSDAAREIQQTSAMEPINDSGPTSFSSDATEALRRSAPR